MSYSILWNPKPQDFLDKLPKTIAVRILEKLDKVKENPFHYFEHYEGEDVYKLRIGDYRALIDVDFSNKVLKIRVLDPRGRVYKK